MPNTWLQRLRAFFRYLRHRGEIDTDYSSPDLESALPKSPAWSLKMSIGNSAKSQFG
jgi:hypothetical protein